MNARSQILYAWGGILCPILLFVGLWPAAHFFPPLSPGLSADELAAIYQTHNMGIRLAAIILLLAGGLYIPFTASVAGRCAVSRRAPRRC